MITRYEKEELYRKAVERLEYFKNTEGVYISVPSIQRMFRVGFTTAHEVIQRLEKEGYVSEFHPNKPREILKIK